jgi:ketosteroid isomerase-like protein
VTATEVAAYISLERMMDNLDVVKGFYAALAAGDMPAVLALLTPETIWNEAENFPIAVGNPYIGPDAIVAGVFAWLGGAWDGFAAKPHSYIDGGASIVVEGRYTGSFKATGKAIDAQFVHVWTLADGSITRFQQYTDTLQSFRATQAG